MSELLGLIDTFEGDGLPDPPTAEQKTFHWSDYVIFAIFLLVSLSIGVYQGWQASRKEASTEDYLVGGRNMSILPVSLSLLAAFLSAILILGTPAEMYTAGTMYWMTLIGQLFACTFAALLFVPLLYRLRLTSSYEYLENRFNSKTTKLTGTLILLMYQLFYMGVCLYSPATALEAVTGFPEWASIILGGLISLVYVGLGGMKASVWTSAFQALIMAAGVIAVIIQGCIDLGGVKNVWDINAGTGRVEFFDFNPDPLVRHTFWTLVVGSWISWMQTYGVNQAAVQRYSSVATLNSARIVVMLNVPGLAIMVSLCALSGMVVFAWYYHVGCDPLTAGYVTNSNQLIAYYVMDRLDYPCVPGLFLACLFAGALSTMSSSVSACAAVTWQDLLKWKFDYLTESQKTWINKFLVVVFACAGIGMGFMAATLGGTVLQMSLSFTGAAGGPMLGLFLLGGLFPCANWIGAVSGAVISLAFALWLSFGSYNMEPLTSTMKNVSMERCVNWSAPILGPNATEPPFRGPDDVEGIERLYLVSYLYYSAIGAGMTMVIGLLVSCFTGFTDVGDIDPKYHIPFFDRLFCCLPNRSLRVLRCYIAEAVFDEDEKHFPELTDDEFLNSGTTDGYDNAGLDKSKDMGMSKVHQGQQFAPTKNDIISHQPTKDSGNHYVDSDPSSDFNKELSPVYQAIDDIDDNIDEHADTSL